MITLTEANYKEIHEKSAEDAWLFVSSYYRNDFLKQVLEFPGEYASYFSANEWGFKTFGEID